MVVIKDDSSDKPDVVHNTTVINNTSSHVNTQMMQPGMAPMGAPMGYGAPPMGAPGYGAPPMGAPGYGAPPMGAPGYPPQGAPGYGAPGYPPPQHY